MMVLSILLGYERILICCRTEKLTKKEEEFDKKLLFEKKYLFQEKFYVQLLFFALIIFLVVMIIIKIINIDKVSFFYTNIFIYNYKNNLDDDDIYKAQLICWIIWIFIEQLIMITYIYRTLTKSIKENIKTELLSFFVLWYIYGLICTFIGCYKKLNSHKNESYNLLLIIISLFVQYICLFLNGFLPIILSYRNKTAINYYFSQKLMNNLYLFLTNEECYEAFSKYLYKINNNRGLFYLKLYTHIMKYKLSFTLNINRNEGYADAVQIYNTYINNNNNLYENLIDPYILNKVRNDCQVMENNTFTPELFDGALQFSFNKLQNIFSGYRKSLEYKEIYNQIKLNSYIHCKMCITGLINKY
jgi:hypothetical protein